MADAPLSCLYTFCDFMLPSCVVVCASRDAVALVHPGAATADRVQHAVECPGDMCDVAAAGRFLVLGRGLGFQVTIAGCMESPHRILPMDDTHAAQVLTVDVSSGGYVATSCADGTISVWDPATYDSERVGEDEPLLLQGHTDWVRFVRFVVADFGKLLLISGGDDGRLLVWDALGGRVLHGLTLTPRCIRCMDVALPGPKIAIAGDDPVIRLFDWDLGVLREDRRFTAHDAPVTAVRLSSEWLCSAAEDEVLKLHRLRDGVCMARSRAHHSARICVGFLTTVTSIVFVAVPPQSTAIIVASCSSDGDYVEWVVRPTTAVGGGLELPCASFERKTRLATGTVLGMAITDVAFS